MHRATMKALTIGLAACSLFWMGSVQPAHSLLTLNFNTVFTGNTPGGTPPWATLTITNNGLGGVNMTLTHNPSSTAGQFLTELDLLSATLPSGASESDPRVDSIDLGDFTNAGLPFNVKVEFPTANQGFQLVPGLSASWTLNGVSESDFSKTPGKAMVHLQGIPGGGSSKIVTPEPASMIALGTGLVSLLTLRRRRA